MEPLEKTFRPKISLKEFEVSNTSTNSGVSGDSICPQGGFDVNEL